MEGVQMARLTHEGHTSRLTNPGRPTGIFLCPYLGHRGVKLLLTLQVFSH